MTHGTALGMIHIGHTTGTQAATVIMLGPTIIMDGVDRTIIGTVHIMQEVITMGMVQVSVMVQIGIGTIIVQQS
jgi:hypothetical protein